MLHLPPAPSSLWAFPYISITAASVVPKRSRAGGSRGRGAASFAAEALPVLLISGMRSQRCPPQWEAANKLIRIMGN